ncbi:MAG TPA: cytochrome d ubiquinol oxidase subunit II [Opitutales bacterium]|nr:cytochrome d ubiquinol oxidase subunit II [Opitutales bacterium]
MFEFIVIVFLFLSLILYALMGGADFGGGMWDLLATGPRAREQREAIARALGPIWEANHVWLILVVVLLFTAFPPAFAALTTALNIPLTVMLVGIVLRGSAFIFRKYDSSAESVQLHWSHIFGAASLLTPFFQGVIVGAAVSGQIHVVNGAVTSGFFAGWLTPFALACGVFALVLFAFLAATYLTVETGGQPELQNDFRRRALGSGFALGPVTLVVYLTSRKGAPDMFHGLDHWWAPLLLLATSLFAIGALLGLWRREFLLARFAAAGQVALILVGWSLVQYPHLVTPDLTFANTAAPEVTLRLLVFALGAGAVLLLPSLAFLFYLFKGRRTATQDRPVK